MAEEVYTVRVQHEPGEELWAEVLELPGCFAAGANMEELREALTEAISLYLPALACSAGRSGAPDPGRPRPRRAVRSGLHADCGPATRIDLDPRDPQNPQNPAPDITVTQRARSPGELLLDVIAARLLTAAAAFPQDTPSSWLPRSPCQP